MAPPSLSTIFPSRKLDDVSRRVRANRPEPVARADPSDLRHRLPSSQTSTIAVARADLHRSKSRFARLVQCDAEATCTAPQFRADCNGPHSCENHRHRVPCLGAAPARSEMRSLPVRSERFETELRQSLPPVALRVVRVAHPFHGGLELVDAISAEQIDRTLTLKRAIRPQKPPANGVLVSLKSLERDVPDSKYLREQNLQSPTVGCLFSGVVLPANRSAELRKR